MVIIHEMYAYWLWDQCIEMKSLLNMELPDDTRNLLFVHMNIVIVSTCEYTFVVTR